MRYVITAETSTPGTGVGTFEARTAKDALEKVRNLRGQKLIVKIKDEHGQPVTEQDLEDDA